LGFTLLKTGSTPLDISLETGQEVTVVLFLTRVVRTARTDSRPLALPNRNWSYRTRDFRSAFDFCFVIGRW